MIKKLKYLLLICLILLLGLVSYTGLNIYRFGQISYNNNSDVILVLGCRLYGSNLSPFLQARLDRAIILNQNYPVKYFVVSGGQGKGESKSEASVMKEYLTNRGIDSRKILIEDRSNSTKENIENYAKILQQINIHQVTIVSNKYHLYRVNFFAKQSGLNTIYSGVYVSQYKFQEYQLFLREIVAVVYFQEVEYLVSLLRG